MHTPPTHELSFTPPPGACDTHIHVYDPAYPLAPTAVAAPPPGTAQEYAGLQRRLGLERSVIVQPTAYGTDNRCTLAGIEVLGRDRTRAVVVVEDTVTQQQLAEFSEAGAVGARFHMRAGAAIGWDQLDTIAGRVADAGWHVQYQAAGELLPERVKQIRAWPCDVVIDHMGLFSDPSDLDDPAVGCLFDLLQTGRVWVKLSAPYISSRQGRPDYGDTAALGKALVKAAPERMLWASDWPHPSEEDAPDDARLLDMLSVWAPDEAVRTRILVDNPAQLYRF
jgi:D-galactarolactone isomerase